MSICAVNFPTHSFHHIWIKADNRMNCADDDDDDDDVDTCYQWKPVGKETREEGGNRGKMDQAKHRRVGNEAG